MKKIERLDKKLAKLYDELSKLKGDYYAAQEKDDKGEYEGLERDIWNLEWDIEELETEISELE